MNCRELLLSILLITTFSNFSTAQTCKAQFEYFVVVENENTAPRNRSVFDPSHKVSFLWSINNGTPVESFQPYHIFTKGSHQICLYLYDSTSNCADTQCQTIQVYESRDCHLEYTIKDTIDSCHIVLIPQLKGRSVIDSLQWSFGDGDTVIQYPPKRIIHQYQQAGRYYTKLTSYGKNGTCKASCGEWKGISGCKDSTLCFNRLKGKILYDVASLEDPVNFPNADRKTWNATVTLIQNDKDFKGPRYSYSCKDCREYDFDSVCPGSYYVKVQLHNDDYNRVNFLPSYPKSEFRWDYVHRPTRYFGSYGDKQRDLNFVRLKKVSGPGSISGTLRNAFKGDPVRLVQVIALDEDMEPVAYSTTNKMGFFEFTDLPLGSYYVFADVVGAEILGDWIEITADMDSVNDVSIIVENDKAYTNIKPIATLPANTPMQLYPNPVGNLLTIGFEGFTGQVQLQDLSGKKLLQSDFHDRLELDLMDIDPGTYLLLFTSKGGQLYHQKVVKY